MKVFWSWQSDHTGKISRHFIRDALQRAISELNEEVLIDESEREIELDHDRKGKTGSPDLAATILEKIQNSDVFIADVSPVGTTANSKKLINSNVAIELGYAMRALGDEAVLMIMNEAFGTREDLPFDLRHKAGPLLYNLNDGSSSEERKKTQMLLIGELKRQLREFVAIRQTESATLRTQIEPDPDNPGRYFKADEVLVVRNKKEFRFSSDHMFFVRVIPVMEGEELNRVEAMKIAKSGDLRIPNPRAGGWSSEHNSYGVITFDADYDSGEITSATQLFLNGEVWGLDSNYLFRDAKNGANAGIPTGVHEQMICQTAHRYVEFTKQNLNTGTPIKIVVGAANIANNFLFMPNSYLDSYWGPIQDAHVVVSKMLRDVSPEEVDAVLLKFFEKVFDAAGKERPVRYNDFPKE